jgi:hypothetical protein
MSAKIDLNTEIGKVDRTWSSALEAALVSGKKRLAEIEQAEQEVTEIRQKENLKAWEAYFEMLKSGLPDVLRPMMVCDGDRDVEPPNMASLSTRTFVAIDCEPWGLAPIRVMLKRVVVPTTHPFERVEYAVESYVVLGICVLGGKAWFEDADDCFEVDPVVEVDLELALARASKHYIRMLDIRMSLNVEEPEYLPADPVECFPGGLVAEKCLVSAIRAIVQNEMYKPPSAA